MKPLRPADLAREHGISTQAVRNYERDGFLPPADRTASGYRIYTERHAAALRAYLALVPAYGHPAAGRIMAAVNRGEADEALAEIDRGHARLLRDRDTLASVRSAVEHLTDGDPTSESAIEQAIDPAIERAGAAGRWTVGEVAHRLGVTPATLRAWEAAGILGPERDPATGYRVYRAVDLRDAELAHLLRRGGYPLEQIASVVRQIRAAGGTERLSSALAQWRQRLTAQGLAMLDAAARLGELLSLPGAAEG
ncbi:TioE family transcriptional regulator [Kitasatospora cinereorecta]|uniref:TioE family transcriptional regulator n=1 Tax=Kitasatospora cinereorecta TaxID=285560 RepID=A0ABW0VC04_9ACTN